MAMTPKVIKSKTQYERTMARVDEIFDAKPGTQEGDELELLLLLVEKYEEEHFPIGLPDPIAAIRFRMDQEKLKPKDLVPYIGSKSKVSEILNGQRELSLTMIRKLVNGLGIPAEVLLKEPNAELGSNDLVEIGKKFPLAVMLKRGWFPGFIGSLRDLKEQIEDVLQRFVEPVGKHSQFSSLSRQLIRNGATMDQAALVAWRIRVLSEAIREPLPAYRRGSVTPTMLAEVAKLSYFEDGPKLAKEYLNKNGVHLIVERHLPKTFLDGAAMRGQDDSRIVALTLRHDRLDNFWFTLLHELAHVALHLDSPDVDIIFDNLEQESHESREQEADAMARDALIPPKEWKMSGLERDHSEERVIRVAEKLKINPAIPAGRIRFEKKDYRLLNDLVGRGRVRPMLEGCPR